MTSSAPASKNRIRSSTSSVWVMHRTGIEASSSFERSSRQTSAAVVDGSVTSMITRLCSAAAAITAAASAMTVTVAPPGVRLRWISSALGTSCSRSRIALAGTGSPGSFDGFDLRIQRLGLPSTSARGGPGRARARLRVLVLSAPPRPGRLSGAYPTGRSHARVRRYELMLVLRPDLADDQSQAVIDRITRPITAAGGQIVKVSPVGPSPPGLPDRSPPRGLVPHHPVRGARRGRSSSSSAACYITEELLRHLVTRVERPVKASRRRTRPTASTRSRIACRRREDEEYDEPRRRVHRRVRERSRSGRDRLTDSRRIRPCRSTRHDHRQSRARSRDALHAQRPGRDPVHGRRQPQLQGARTASGRKRPSGSGSSSGASRPSAPRSTCARATRSTSRAASRPASGKTRTARSATPPSWSPTR